MGRLGLTIQQINERIEGKSRLKAVCFINPYRTPGGQTQRKVNAVCSCGKVIRVLVKSMVNLETISCGCFAKEATRLRSTKFYPVIPALHHVYNAMISRCYNPLNKDYQYYGERGVQVCSKWRGSYQNFLDWAISSGYKKGLHLDKDTKGNGMLYSPETCTWVDRITNINHTRKNTFYQYRGESLTMAQLCNKYNMDYSKMRHRIIYMGLTVDEALVYSRTKN